MASIGSKYDLAASFLEPDPLNIFERIARATSSTSSVEPPPSGQLFMQYVIQDDTLGTRDNLSNADYTAFLNPTSYGFTFDFSDNTDRVTLTGGDFDDILRGGAGFIWLPKSSFKSC